MSAYSWRTFWRRRGEDTGSLDHCAASVRKRSVVLCRLSPGASPNLSARAADTLHTEDSQNSTGQVQETSDAESNPRENHPTHTPYSRETMSNATLERRRIFSGKPGKPPTPRHDEPKYAAVRVSTAPPVQTSPSFQSNSPFKHPAKHGRRWQHESAHGVTNLIATPVRETSTVRIVVQ